MGASNTQLILSELDLLQIDSTTQVEHDAAVKICAHWSDRSTRKQLDQLV